MTTTNPAMLRRETDGVVLYQFTHLLDVPGLLHALTTRIGGVSRPPWDTLNLGLHVGDRTEDVLRNRRRVADVLKFSPEQWVSTQQVHQTHVARIDASHRGDLADGGVQIVRETDALVTVRGDTRDMLSVFSADCPLVLLVHREGKALGLAHASWRTTVGGIVAKTVRLLCETSNVKPEDLLAGIAPSIGPDCYKVGPDVYETARTSQTQCQRFMRPTHPDKWLFNLWDANVAQLQEAGLPRDHIVVAGICSHCRTEEFYSYRAEGQTGRYALIAGFR